MKSTHTAELPLPGIPKQARTVHVFPSLGTNLVGVTPLTQAGCSVHFEGTTCTIQCPGGETITCHATPQGLWALQIHELHQQYDHFAFSAKPAIGHDCTPANIVAFHHAALFSPALSTLTKALKKGYLPPLPGLTETLLRKYPPDLEATTMGHLDNRRKNIQSTKAKRVTFPDDQEEDPFPEQPKDNNRTNFCFLTTSEPKHIVYTDQTGRLPQPSNSGNNYLLIAYDYDSNSILLRPYKNKTAQVLMDTIAQVHDTLTRGGCRPLFHRLDNECPAEVKAFFKERTVDYQLAPPHDHRVNAAERAIRTSKNHLAAGWWSMDDHFPMSLWDKTISQAELTLNLLRGSRINPKLSAWEQIHGRYDFNRTPIAPPGIKVLAHMKAEQRLTWSPHAFPAWYIGPALEHYRCYTVWNIKTRHPCHVNQLIWFPPKPFPKLTSADLLRATIEDLRTILLSPPTETYIGNMEQSQRGELIQFSDILHNHTSTTGLSKHQAKNPTPLLGVPRPDNPAPELGVAPTTGPRRSNRTTTEPDRYCAPAINPDTNELAEYKVLVRSSAGKRWGLGMCKEMGRLFQGYIHHEDTKHSVQGTLTCFFISIEEIPEDKKATYIRITAEYRPQKEDPYRVRCTVGGNQIDFPGDKSTKTAELITIKCLLNKAISTPNGRTACLDLKDFYLKNPLPTYEYVFFLASTIPPEFFEQYKDVIIVTSKGHVYARVEKGMYGLPQAGKVASDTMNPRLATEGYVETGRIPGLFKHKTNGIYFALVVDDFLVLYTNPEALDHLATTLRKHYDMTIDLTATKYCGITLAWNYEEGHVTLSMPGYIEKALHRFTHPSPAKPQHAPHAWEIPQYGARVQYAEDECPML
jgi:hypothetical protein